MESQTKVIINLNEANILNKEFKNSIRPVIVLDLDDTIINCSLIRKSSYSFSIKIGNHQRAYINSRPGLHEFLKEVSSMFEIFFFTASSNIYGNQIINIMAPETPDNHRLFRDSCKNIFGYSVKDLSILDRPMNKIMLIDDIHGSALLQPDNLIRITPWNGKDDDSVLLEQLLPVLVRIKDENDLPNAFKKIINSEHFEDLLSFE